MSRGGGGWRGLFERRKNRFKQKRASCIYDPIVWLSELYSYKNEMQYSIKVLAEITAGGL